MSTSRDVADPRVRRLVPMELPPKREPSYGRTIFVIVAAMCVLPIALVGFHAIANAQDPIERAVEHEQDLNGWRETVDESFAELRAGLEDFRLPAVEREAIAAEHLREIIPMLRQVGVWLVENYGQFERDVDSLGNSLQESGPVLRAAAQQYRDLANDETDARIADQLMSLAEETEHLAEQRADQLAELERNSADAATRLEFVGRSLLFLDRLEQFLEFYDARDRDRVNNYLRELNSYLEAYESVFRSFQEMRSITDAPQEAA